VRAALDTNILVYAEGLNGAPKKAVALELIGRLPGDSGVLPAQVLGELFSVLVRKARQTPRAARTAILRWQDAFPIIDTSAAVLTAAADLAADHKLGIWDAVIFSAAVAADCRLLLSEDFQDGFTWHGVTVVNPFATKPHALLETLIRG